MIPDVLSIAGSAPAVAQAKAYLLATLAAAERLEVGHGAGPLHRFHALD